MPDSVPYCLEIVSFYAILRSACDHRSAQPLLALGLLFSPAHLLFPQSLCACFFVCLFLLFVWSGTLHSGLLPAYLVDLKFCLFLKGSPERPPQVLMLLVLMPYIFLCLLVHFWSAFLTSSVKETHLFCSWLHFWLHFICYLMCVHIGMCVSCRCINFRGQHTAVCFLLACESQRLN